MTEPAKKTVRTALAALSLLFNLLFTAFLLFALSRKTASLALYDPGGGSIASALVASVPAGSGPVTFNTVELDLRPGETATLQFSSVAGRRQANWLLGTLYDRRVVRVEANGFGISIRALAPGETVLQTLTGEGVRDAALVRVHEPR